jgi:hypothetical protein
MTISIDEGRLSMAKKNEKEQDNVGTAIALIAETVGEAPEQLAAGSVPAPPAPAPRLPSRTVTGVVVAAAVVTTSPVTLKNVTTPAPAALFYEGVNAQFPVMTSNGASYVIAINGCNTAPLEPKVAELLLASGKGFSPAKPDDPDHQD